ncbi:hypothetical protein M406DRAFT_55134, partial [Cryphonectria parasitica EP155]
MPFLGKLFRLYQAPKKRDHEQLQIARHTIGGTPFVPMGTTDSLSLALVPRGKGESSAFVSSDGRDSCAGDQGPSDSRIRL